MGDMGDCSISWMEKHGRLFLRSWFYSHLCEGGGYAFVDGVDIVVYVKNPIIWDGLGTYSGTKVN